MDKVLLFRATIYCFLIFPYILSAFKGETQYNLNGFPRNLDINDLNLITNRNNFRKEFSLEKANQRMAQIVTECCQTVEELIQPKGGVSRNGRILELYRDVNSTQNFFQNSCKERGKLCARFKNSKTYLAHFECVQKYSYTYALVKEFNAPESYPWRLDYIRIRNGCACERTT